MAFTLESLTQGKAQRAPRILLGGVSGIGKSTLAASAPDPVFIPIKGEEGIDEIDAVKFPTVSTFAELMECFAALGSGGHDRRTVVIDSMTALERLVWRKTCEDANPTVANIEQVGGGFGKGYIAALNPWGQLQESLDYLREKCGMGSVLIAHVKVKTFNDPTTDPYDRYQVDLQDRAASLFDRWADAVLFANYKTYARTVAQQGDKKTVHAVGSGDRALYTQQRPSHFGKNRYALPYEVPFNFGQLYAAIAASQQTSKPAA